MQAQNETLLQGMMDQAYAKWQGKDWNYSDFLGELDAMERKVVLIGTLNAQVCNGGFGQWADNGYGIKWQDVIKVLEQIGTETCRKIAELVETVGQQLTYNRHGRLEYPRNRYGDIDEDSYLEFDEQDGIFYDINDEMMDQLADWVRQQQAK